MAFKMKKCKYQNVWICLLNFLMFFSLPNWRKRENSLFRLEGKKIWVILLSPGFIHIYTDSLFFVRSFVFSVTLFIWSFLHCGAVWVLQARLAAPDSAPDLLNSLCTFSRAALHAWENLRVKPTEQLRHCFLLCLSLKLCFVMISPWPFRVTR